MKPFLLFTLGAALAVPAGAANFVWSSGNYFPGLTSPDPLLAPDILQLTTGATKSFNGVNFTNTSGTVEWEDGTVSLSEGAAVTNGGLWDAQGNNSITYFGGAATTFTNSGTFRKSGGTGFTWINTSDSLRFINSGTIDAQTGGIVLTGGNEFKAGSVFTGAGQVLLGGNNDFSGGFTSSNLEILSGIQTGFGAVLNGTMSMRAGRLSGSWTVANGSVLKLLSSFDKTLAGTLFNNGTVTWTAGLITSGTYIINNGLWDAQGNNVLIAGPHIFGFTNNGTFRKSDGTFTTSIDNKSGNFRNPGVMEVLSGTIAFTHPFNNIGTMAGTATYRVSTLTNFGTVAPGASTGTLSLSGNYVQTAAGTLAIEIASTSAFDLFRVSGTTALNGTLALSCILTCAIATGDSFVILDSDGALSGSFANVTLSGFLPGFDYSLDYDTTNNWVKLNVLFAGTPGGGGGGGGVIPEPATWAMLIAGFGLVGAAVRRRRQAPA